MAPALVRTSPRVPTLLATRREYVWRIMPNRCLLSISSLEPVWLSRRRLGEILHRCSRSGEARQVALRRSPIHPTYHPHLLLMSGNNSGTFTRQSTSICGAPSGVGMPHAELSSAPISRCWRECCERDVPDERKSGCLHFFPRR